MNLPILHAGGPRRGGGRRRAFVLGAALACAAASVPAAAQTGEPAAQPAAPTTSIGRKIFDGLHAEMGMITSSAVPEFRYSGRYGISPDLARTIVATAKAEGVDPELGFRLVRVESGFNPRARNHSGAAGLMQLMPSTFRRYSRTARGETSLMDPETNLRVGFRYMRMLLDMFDGDVHLAVTAYNRGEDNVARVVRRGERPSSSYTSHVLGTGGSNPYQGPGRISKAAAAAARTSADRR
ncbi:MAG: hypothetical protein JWM27_4032 [Gemmatimonadetes bacterium]|nr:hypothetical protein [Gemmatimonadota bacterium]